ncbi:uncharacterized protein LOC128257157 [Drosophila gunungcola]|uniref:uncharacterized protein LOC128257157 n=1 Tax=Drosophila gunungcola TaxID=103775 RepID=UPI0022E4F6AB|nr:uncharacterized protein LOC128257157 [Drosophila gunungcola]
MASPSSRNSFAHKKPPPPPVPARPIIVPRQSMLQFEPHEEQRISRCRYMVLVYLLFAVLLQLALVQWEVVSYYKPLTNFFLAKYWLSVCCMLISVPLLAVFLLVRQARYMPILGWVLFCLIIELMVIGICTFAAYCNAWHFLIYFTITAMLIMTSVLIGSFIPCDLTANVAVVFLVSIQIFLVSIFLLMTFMMIDSADGFFYPFAALVLVIVCMFTMYHAQLIRGWRYAELYTTDGLFAVIVIFCHFCIVLMLFCYLEWKDADENDGLKDIDDVFDEITENYDESVGLRGLSTDEFIEGVIRLCCASKLNSHWRFLGQAFSVTTQDGRRRLSLPVDIIITSIILDHIQMTTTAKVAHK